MDSPVKPGNDEEEKSTDRSDAPTVEAVRSTLRRATLLLPPAQAAHRRLWRAVSRHLRDCRQQTQPCPAREPNGVGAGSAASLLAGFPKGPATRPPLVLGSSRGWKKPLEKPDGRESRTNKGLGRSPRRRGCPEALLGAKGRGKAFPQKERVPRAISPGTRRGAKGTASPEKTQCPPIFTSPNSLSFPNT